MKTHIFTVDIEKGEDGYFVVSVPALPGCFSQGDTYEEAVLMAEDAIRGYLQLMVERGEQIPVEPEPSHVALAIQLTPVAA